MISKRIRIGISICCMFLSLPFYAQDINQSYTLNWHKPYYEKISEDLIISYLFFDNASLCFTDKRTPRFWCRFPLNNGNVTAAVNINNPVWQEITSEELKLIDIKLIADTLSMQAFVEYTRKEPALQVEFLPFRKQGAHYEKLLSFQLQATLSAQAMERTHKSQTYAANSVLQQGGFYKVAITQTGIHKITYEQCVALGMDVASLRTYNLAVFGNGGRMLPESTSAPVFDDLQETAIEVVDNNGNGLLEQGDYILFYAEGVTSWNYVPTDNIPFGHEMNIYTPYAYYFITAKAGVGEKKRVQSIPSLASGATHTVNTYYYYSVYEKELLNVSSVGRVWFGEEYNLVTSYNYPFSVSGISKSKPLSLRIRAGLKSSVASAFVVKVNNVSLPVVSFPAMGGDYGALLSPFVLGYTPTSDELNVNVTYNKPTDRSCAWLDYIELHATRSLAQHAALTAFRNPEVVGNGNVANYQFDTKGKNTQIWDVTDPHNSKRVQTTKNGNILTFLLTADSLREFFAFDGSSFYNVIPIGGVPAQNLHALSNRDFIIITHPDFEAAANRLANFRRTNDNMRVEVVTTTKIYNEFNSGACDIGAIRNFLKMFYDKETSANMPKNVLLIGKTSFDPRNITGSNSCFIPNYQGSTNVFEFISCASADNFFTKLADGKGTNNTGTMDMGLGRFSVITNAQANDLVQKSINYASYDNLAPNNKYVSNLANWRNIVAFLADDIDPSMNHRGDIESICPQIVSNQPYLNIEKIYCDAYKKVISAQGARYPDVTKAMNDRISKGCLLFTYFGHGGDNGWGHERILMRSDITSWTNPYCLPFFYTACCSFSHYDKLNGTSPAEDILLKTNGGAIALISSTRDTYSSGNRKLGQSIYARAFEQNNNTYLTMGELYAKAEADCGGSDANANSYVLLGDPSATLAHPKYNVVTDSINGIALAAWNDTIKSLQYVTISGHIADPANALSPFNGWVYPSIYDKTDSVSVINPAVTENVKFPLQKSIIFRGKASVKNGYFSFSFMTPKDLNYEYGLGKISYYATGEKMDAKGYNALLIGGMNDTTIDDKNGPDIVLSFNDEKFVNGGITSPAPVLYAKLSDASGINTTGAGIGHDIIAIIDGDMSKSIVLNDYFEYDTNSCVSGELYYALSALPEGKHTLTLRAWDIVNNMGESTLDFEVMNETELQIKHVLNYPNPFTTSTQFYFEHNRPNTPLLIHVQIFTISGKVVKSILQTQQTTGFRSNPIPWNGRDEYGDRLARGIYIYKLQVVTPDGKSVEKIEKMAIL